MKAKKGKRVEGNERRGRKNKDLSKTNKETKIDVEGFSNNVQVNHLMDVNRIIFQNCVP